MGDDDEFLSKRKREGGRFHRKTTMGRDTGSWLHCWRFKVEAMGISLEQAWSIVEALRVNDDGAVPAVSYLLFNILNYFIIRVIPKLFHPIGGRLKT